MKLLGKILLNCFTLCLLCLTLSHVKSYLCHEHFRLNFNDQVTTERELHLWQCAELFSEKAGASEPCQHSAEWSLSATSMCQKNVQCRVTIDCTSHELAYKYAPYRQASTSWGNRGDIPSKCASNAGREGQLTPNKAVTER